MRLYHKISLTLVLSLFSSPKMASAANLAERFKSGAVDVLESLEKSGIQSVGTDRNKAAVRDILEEVKTGKIKFIEVPRFKVRADPNRQNANYSVKNKTISINEEINPDEDILPYLSVHETLSAYGLPDPDYQLSIGAYFFLKNQNSREPDTAMHWRKTQSRNLLLASEEPTGGATKVSGGGDGDAMIYKIRIMEALLVHPSFKDPGFVYFAAPWIQVELMHSPLFNRAIYSKVMSPVQIAPNALKKTTLYDVRPRIVIPRHLVIDILEGRNLHTDPTFRDIVFFLQSFFWAQRDRAADFTYLCDGEIKHHRNPQSIHPLGFLLFEKEAWQAEQQQYQDCRSRNAIRESSTQ